MESPVREAGKNSHFGGDTRQKFPGAQRRESIC